MTFFKSRATASVFGACILLLSFTSCAVPELPPVETTETNRPSNDVAEVTTSPRDTETEAETETIYDIDDYLNFTPSNPDDFDFEIWYEPLTEPVTRDGNVFTVFVTIKNNSDQDFIVKNGFRTTIIAEMSTVTPDGTYVVPNIMDTIDMGYPAKDVLPAGETATSWWCFAIPLDAPAGSYTLWFKFYYMNKEMTVENFFVLDELPTEETTETAE